MSTILVVDDEPAIRRALRRMLEHEGYEVLEAPGGVEALCVLEYTTPDILITDVQMPGCDGFELTRTIRQSGRRQPRIIVLSGDDERGIADQVRRIGGTALHKPFTREELLATLAHVASGRLRVLVVDDQPDVRLAFRYMLEADDHLVAEAADGREAMTYLDREPVDVLLTDLCMPVMDGLALLRQLRTGPFQFPHTVAFTGAAVGDRVTALEEARLLGAHVVLEKPVSREQLLKAMQLRSDESAQASA